METTVIKVNLDAYLVDFVVTQLGGNRQPVRAGKESYIGSLLYRLLDKVPENCHYQEPLLANKRVLEIEIGSMGARDEDRKRPYTHYYFPVSKQREFESAVRDMFNELFFHIIEITKEYTDQQYVDLIDVFCERYNIDFARHFDALKKKHYRARLESIKSEKNKIHARPVKSAYQASFL